MEQSNKPQASVPTWIKLLISFRNLLHASICALQEARNSCPDSTFKHKLRVPLATLDKLHKDIEHNYLSKSAKSDTLDTHRAFIKRMEDISNMLLSVQIVIAATPAEHVQELLTQIELLADDHYQRFGTIRVDHFTMNGYRIVEVTDTQWKFEGDEELRNDKGHKAIFFPESGRIQLAFKPEVLDAALLDYTYHFDCVVNDYSALTYLFSCIKLQCYNENERRM